jgi:hypothetical protein
MASSSRIINPAVPNLPLGTEEYERRYQDQFANVLRLYFNQLRNSLTELLGNVGGKYIAFPYGAFSSYTSQSTTANTATLLTLSNTDFANTVSLQTGSKITVANAGIYNLQFSIQLSSLDNAPTDTSIWLRKNGTDIVGSTGLIGMLARKSPSDPSHDIKGWNYFISMAANDYVQMYWSSTSASVSIDQYPAAVSPTRPSTASVVATLSFVSAI